MTNIQFKDTAPELKPGIDVGAEGLILVIRKKGKAYNPQKSANTFSLDSVFFGNGLG